KNKDDSQDGSTNSEDTIEVATGSAERMDLRCIKMINQHFAQLEQTNLIDNGSNFNRPSDNEPPTRQNPEISRMHKANNWHRLQYRTRR
ncbi:36498_t:CDS:2, partial [Racocetra persica]